MKMLSEDSGIIIQARSLSSRLPNKLFLPFYGDDGIIDLIIQGLLKNVDKNSKIVLATSDNNADDIFVEITKKYSIKLFRGDENNVLNRFIHAAKTYNFENIIRICADNPIYDFSTTIRLLDFHIKNRNDYTAYGLERGMPSIKSHFGFWGEVVSLKALEKVQNMTDNKIFLEHVTNYIYSNLDFFKIQLIKASQEVYSRKDIRLTVDTIEDFKIVQEIYVKLKEKFNVISIKDVVSFVDSNEHYLEIMKDQISKNTK